MKEHNLQTPGQNYGGNSSWIQFLKSVTNTSSACLKKTTGQRSRVRLDCAGIGCFDSWLAKYCGSTERACHVQDEKDLVEPWPSKRNGHEEHQVNPKVPEKQSWSNDNRVQIGLETSKRPCEGSVLTFSDPGSAGGSDKHSASGTGTGNTAGCQSQQRAQNNRRSHSVVTNAEMVVSLTRAGEGMGLRQLWHWPLNFGFPDTVDPNS